MDVVMNGDFIINENLLKNWCIQYTTTAYFSFSDTNVCLKRGVKIQHSEAINHHSKSDEAIPDRFHNHSPLSTLCSPPFECKARKLQKHRRKGWREAEKWQVCDPECIGVKILMFACQLNKGTKHYYANGKAVCGTRTHLQCFNLKG